MCLAPEGHVYVLVKFKVKGGLEANPDALKSARDVIESQLKNYTKNISGNTVNLFPDVEIVTL